MIKLLIVEDHHLVRLGLRGILDDAPGIEIIGEAESGEEALQLCRDLVPDVILMDISLPGLSGFETSCRILRQLPDVRILALTAHAQAPYPARLMDMGVAGFLTKACSASELVQAIRTVHCGERLPSRFRRTSWSLTRGMRSRRLLSSTRVSAPLLRWSKTSL